MALSLEEIYLQLRDEIRKRENLEVRVNVLDDFIKKQYPGFFAGEAETIADPAIAPLEIPLGKLVGELPQDKTGLVLLEETDGVTE